MDALSLWLIPEQEIYKKFQLLIKQLAAEYNSILFEPHVTLFGDVDVKDPDSACRLIASKIKPYTIKLDAVDYTERKYRALFIRVKKTPEVLNAYEITRKIVGSDETDYMPHLSIYYGSLPVEAKESIIKKIGKTFTDEFIVNAIYCMNTPLNRESDWKIVQKYPLHP